MEAIDIISKLKKSIVDKCRDRIEESQKTLKEEIPNKKEYGITSRLKNKRLF